MTKFTEVYENFDPRKSVSQRVADRIEKTKMRLAFLLLDIFLGGFAVGIVLMVTLGRPADEAVAAGSGSKPFVLIEFYWNQSDRILAPVMVYNEQNEQSIEPASLQTLNTFHPQGLAARWESRPLRDDRPWPGYNTDTGLMETRHSFFKQIGMDGFFLSSNNSLSGPLSETVRIDKQYGSIWLSEPCQGQWFIGLREVERGLSINQRSPIDILMRVTMSGFIGLESNQESEFKVIISNPQTPVTKGAAETLPQQDQNAFHVIHVPLPETGERFAHCPMSELS